ncbi:MAG: hypothetical protein KGD59_12280 [Candidatus Heimdallarchaeota archaeon]|jgi:uncharacterized protein (TIGR00288 family)|nr:hypothetical protein [Candidatus Heimdallarchaeota archaeon]MBY8995321.1 hypothetical protein [Candidatus Heimdallarchaeota archaeon]
MLSRVGKALRIITDDEKKKIAIIIDGPTILPDFDLNKLNIIKESLIEIGVTKAGIIITDKQLSQNESELINSFGFHEEIVGSDVDIHVAINALEYMNSNAIDIIGIGTTDPGLFPIFSRIKQNKQLLIITWQKNLTPAMESIADFVLELDYLE